LDYRLVDRLPISLELLAFLLVLETSDLYIEVEICYYCYCYHCCYGFELGLGMVYAGIFITPSEARRCLSSDEARCAPTLDSVAFKSLLISIDYFHRSR
jgi:hypothetical protein